MSGVMLTSMVCVPAAVLAPGVNVAVHVMVLPLAAPQLVGLYVPRFALPPMVTAPVGAAPPPLQATTAVIVAGASWPRLSEAGLTLVTSIVVEAGLTNWPPLNAPKLPAWLLSPE